MTGHKKHRLLAGLAILIGAGMAFSRAGAQEEKPRGDWVTDREGFWVEAPPRDSVRLTSEQKRLMKKLNSIGYLSGYSKARSETGVTTYKLTETCDGLNYYVSGHGPEAFLIDMKGVVLQRWSYDYEKIEAPGKIESVDPLEKHSCSRAWRRAFLFDNGDLLALYEGYGLIKVDKFSRMLWFFPGRAHHDLFVTDGGEIYVLTREARMIPRVNRTNPTLEDFISVLDGDGVEQKKVSVLEALEKSSAGEFAQGRWRKGGDVFHTNTVVLLDGSLQDRHPAFKAGNVLISIRNLHALAVVDMEKEEVVWAERGEWREQHEPVVMPNHNVLLFDNMINGYYSRVIEFEPFTEKVVWEYKGTPPASFYSRFCGSVQPLPNGNILITETGGGRALEVKYDTKETVWEFYNPHRAGENNELIAALFEVVRLAPDFPTAWIPE